MPELGRYAAQVLSAYVVSLGLIAGLVWLSLAQSARVRKRLGERERRRG